MLLQKHHRFVGCKIDTIGLKGSLFGISEVIARQILNEESDIVGEADVRAQERVCCLPLTVSALNGKS